MALIFVVISIALVFEYINGFHDSANSIATVVATKVLTPRQAVMMAACTNLIGAMCGTAVATTITSGLIDPRIASQKVLLCALLGAVVWNLVTWRAGLPSSSSHALIGGLVGAAVAAAGDFRVVIWSEPDATHWYASKGLLWKVVIPMFASPLSGFVLGFFIMGLLYALLRNWKPRTVNGVFGKAQMFSAAGMGLMHGTNDAQKTMGIIVGLLVSVKGLLASQTGFFHHLYVPDEGIPLWVKLGAYTAISLGTLFGGWRIVNTMGSRITRLRPVSGFAAETGGALAITLATHYGIPVSTTHTIAGSIIGAGATYRFSAVRWGIARRIVWAWIITIPASASVAAASYWVLSRIAG